MSNIIVQVADLALAANPGYTSNTINVLGDKQYYAFRLDESATITTVGVRQNTRTNTTGSSPAAYTGTVRMGIQGLSATTGLNDGTWVGGTSNYVDISSWTSANDGKYVTATLPNSVTLSRGVPYCVIAELTTAASSGAVGIASIFSNTTFNGSFPYTLDETVVAIDGKPTNASRFPFLLRSASKTYGLPIESWSTQAIASNTAVNEVGLGFTIPSGYCTSYKVNGAWLTYATPGNVDFSYDMILYEGTTALQTTTIDAAQTASAGSSRRYELVFDVTTLSTLNAGTEYIIAMKGTAPSTTASVTVRTFGIPTAGDRTAFGPYNFKYYTRAGTGSWTENTTLLPLFGVSIDEMITSGGAYPIFGGMVIK